MREVISLSIAECRTYNVPSEETDSTYTIFDAATSGIFLVTHLQLSFLHTNNLLGLHTPMIYA